MNSTNAPLAQASAHPAHAGWRLLALVYDTLPMIPLVMIISLLFLWLNGGRPVTIGTLMWLLFWATVFGLVGCYFVFSWRRGGQTMGMRPWRLKLLAADGRLAPLKSLWLRYAVACATPGLCLLWTLVDKDRRGLHDLAAGTSFVRMDGPATKPSSR